MQLALLTGLAAALRLATLDRQSLWSDEAVTALLAQLSLSDLLRTIGGTESTPPLYYLIVWGWTKLFGHGEVGLRSLSALAGTATVPVAYAAGVTLLGRRAGLAAALVVAVSPVAVWYSQEARAYAVAIFLSAVSFAAFARALASPTRHVLALWAVSSGLALATHYFAAFVVAAECAWLLAVRRRPAVYVATLGVSLAAVALAPLALHQRASGFAQIVAPDDPVGPRIVVVVKQVLVGESLPADRAVAALVAALVVASVALLAARGERAERLAAAVALTVGGGAFAVPVLLAAVGLDYLNARNVLVGLVPLAVVVAAGFAVAAPRAVGAAALGGVSAIFLTVTVAVAADPAHHRPDWRGFARAAGPPDGIRALVVAPDHLGWFARIPLRIYLPAARAVDRELVPTPPQFEALARRAGDRASPASVTVQEVVVAGVGWGIPTLPRPLPPPFEAVETATEPGFGLRRYRSPHPVTLSTRSLAADRAAVLVQRPQR